MMIRSLLAAAFVVSGTSPTGAQAPPKRIVAEPAKSRFSIDTPIVQLLANPRAKAVFARHMPTVVSNPHLKQFEKLSLRQLASNPHASIAASKIRALEADLAKIR